MAEQYAFHTDTPLAKGLRNLLEQLGQRLKLDRPVKVYLAGGMAVHLYTGDRVTTDVDAEFGERVLIPNDLAVEVVFDGSVQFVYWDTNYSSSFALMHENYTDDAVPVDLGVPSINVYVLAPVDLAVSKIARLQAHDLEDIQSLVRGGLTTPEAIESRATEAAATYVGGRGLMEINIQDAVAAARVAAQTPQMPPR